MVIAQSDRIETAQDRDGLSGSHDSSFARQSLVRRFLLRAVGTLLLIGGLTTWFVHSQLDWGERSIPVVSMAMVFAFLMGLASFMAARQGILNAGTQATPVLAALLGGMLVCVLLLFGSYGVANAVFDGANWGQRTLFTTLGFYMAMIAVKIVTLSQELQRIKKSRESKN